MGIALLFLTCSALDTHYAHRNYFGPPSSYVGTHTLSSFSSGCGHLCVSHYLKHPTYLILALFSRKPTASPARRLTRGADWTLAPERRCHGELQRRSATGVLPTSAQQRRRSRG